MNSLRRLQREVLEIVSREKVKTDKSGDEARTINVGTKIAVFNAHLSEAIAKASLGATNLLAADR